MAKTRILDQFGRPYSAASTAAYRGGGITRLTRDWLPAHRSGDGAIAENWDLLTSRIRDLFRNEPTIRNARRSLCKYVVGPGIQTFAAAKLTREEFDDDFNDESDDEFEIWENEEADAEGKLSWPEMQWQILSETCEVGESLLLRCADDDPGRSVPLCYQILEAEQLDCTKNWPAGANADGTPRARCVRGVELGARNRPIAYWLYDVNPYDLGPSGWSASGSQRVLAERVIHTYLHERPSMNRGVTWFGCNVQSTRDLDWYVGNEMTAAALGALLTLIVKRKHGAGSGLGFEDDDEDECGLPSVKLGAGLVADLGAEDSIEVAESKRPNRDAAPFLKLIMMLQGMGVGLSYLRMTGDYSQSSYTSARGAHLDDQAFFIVLQSWFGRGTVLPVRQAHMREAAAYGLYENVTPRQFARAQRRYLRFDLQPPGREQLDPEKETSAARERIDCGLSTLKKECGLRGDHWRRIARQRAREFAFNQRLAKSLGIPLGEFINFRTNPAAQAAKDAAKDAAKKQTSVDEFSEDAGPLGSF